MTTTTIRNCDLERIVARLENRAPRFFDGSCVFWRDGLPCEQPAFEMLVPIHGDAQPAFPVCADHLAEHLRTHLPANAREVRG